MNNGLFGFFVGANVTLNVQEFEEDGVWVKPPNAQLCFIEGTGGGQAGGGNEATATTRQGGCAGVAYQIILNASELQATEIVDIGAGGVSANETTGPDGSDTTFAGLYWAGGTGGSGTTSIRHPLHGASVANGWGAGGHTLSSPGFNGAHGGFGAGGGGRGGATGSPGGKPRSFKWASEQIYPLRGDGAPGNTDARPEFDVDGFGEGAGGGAGTGAGKKGRRGSGGGSVGSTAVNTPGGNGGNGFLRVITYCWG